jgi:ATP-binding cassette subfamily B protein/ATP-binding cassette subfamily C protein
MSNYWRVSEDKLTVKKVVSVVWKSTKMMFKTSPLGTSFIAVSSVIDSVIPSFTALLAGLSINAITQLDWQSFVFYMVVTLVLTIVEAVTRHVSGYFNWKMQYDIQNYALEQLYLKVTKIPLAVRELKENSDKLEIAENYGLDLGWLFPRSVGVISQVIAFITAFVVLANVSLPIAVVAFVVLIPNIFLTIYRMRRERKYWKDNSVGRRKGWGFRSTLTDQKLAMEMKIYGLSGFFIKQWRHHVTRDRAKIMETDKKLLPYETAMSGLDSLVRFGALLWSGKLVVDGSLEVGYLVTINSLMNNLSNAGTALTVSISQVGASILNAGDYFDYLELPEEKTGPVVLESDGRPPKIEFKNVVFTYPMNDEPTIKNVSFVIEPGEDIALVGENGSGKTTIIKLLMGVYKQDSGQILIDDVPLEKLNMDAYYKRVGALFQDYARMFFADLGDNIWYGDITRKKSEKEVMVAADRAKLGPLMKQLPNGLKQILSKEYDEKNGTDLSGGQWQRVALARGFFRDADVLILDEPTAAVDAKAEYEIFKEIAKNQQEKTTIIISHRFSTVRKAQKILVIDGGKVIENGTHQELMRHEDGLYHEMFTLQAEGYLD